MTHFRWRHLPALLLLGAALQGVALAQEPTGRPATGIAGTVTVEGAGPVAGALVSILDTPWTTTTDATGHYRIEVPPGEYRVRVTVDGIAPAERTVRVDAPAWAVGDVVLERTSRFSDEVTVVAVRASSETPISKTDVTREEIERLNVGQEMPFLLKAVPSLTQYSDTGIGAGYSYMYLRGIPQTRMNMTLDGVPLNEAEDSALYFVDFGDFASSVGSVQVQRGVGTSTVGAASFAGSINFASLDLSDAREISARVGLGSFGTTQASVAVQSGAFGPGLRVYARVSYQDTDGFREHSGVTQGSTFFGASQQRDRSYWKVFGFVGRERTQLAFLAADAATLETNLRANPMSPEERDRFGQQFLQGQYHRAIGTSTEWSVQAYYNGAAGWYRIWSDPSQAALNEYSLDWRMLGAATTGRHARGPLSVTWGVYANDFESTHAREMVGGAPDYENHGHKNEVNTFGKVGYDVGRWYLYGDAQLRWARFDYRGDLDIGDVSWTFLNPRVGARYALSPGWSVYGSVGRGMREPARSDLFAGEDNPSVVYDLEAVKPERVVDLEGGVEYSSQRFAAHANLYAMEFRNEIALTGELSENGLPLRRNVDRSYRRGLELDLTWRPVEPLAIRYTANASRNRIREWVQYFDVYDADGAYAGREPRAFANVAPLLAPAYVGNLAVDWSAGHGVTVGAASRHVSSAFLDNTNAAGYTTPAWFNLDLAGAIDLGRVVRTGSPVLRVRVTNVLDSRNQFPSGYSYLYYTQDGPGSLLPGGTAYYYPLATRAVVVTLDVGVK